MRSRRTWKTLADPAVCFYSRLRSRCGRIRPSFGRRGLWTWRFSDPPLGRPHEDPQSCWPPACTQRPTRRPARLTVERDLVSVIQAPRGAGVGSRVLEGCMAWRMWYDYFSVPQPGVEDDPSPSWDLRAALQRAVSSLAAYVQACMHFVVLAPTVRHESGRACWARVWGVISTLRCPICFPVCRNPVAVACRMWELRGALAPASPRAPPLCPRHSAAGASHAT